MAKKALQLQKNDKRTIAKNRNNYILVFMYSRRIRIGGFCKDYGNQGEYADKCWEKRSVVKGFSEGEAAGEYGVGDCRRLQNFLWNFLILVVHFNFLEEESWEK